MAYEISSAVSFSSSCFEVLSSSVLIFLSSIIDDGSFINIMGFEEVTIVGLNFFQDFFLVYLLLNTLILH